MFPTIPKENDSTIDRADWVRQDLIRIRHAIDAVAECLEIAAADNYSHPEAKEGSAEVECSTLGLTWAVQYLLREHEQIERRALAVMDDLIERGNERERVAREAQRELEKDGLHVADFARGPAAS